MNATRLFLTVLSVAALLLVTACGGGGKSVDPTCDDGLFNGDETDVDCGGSCGFCAAGGGCATDGDCKSKICTDLKCQAAACDDGVLNGYETDVDCGGSCAGCQVGKLCRVGGNCDSGSCRNGQCQTPSCDDGVQNGSEQGLDCGGGCGPCPAGSTCTAAEDCLSSVCAGGLCQPPACDDETANGDETGQDCGGDTCEPCPATEGCEYDRDCLSGVCLNGLCQEPNCFDGVANGEELGVDCAGPCDPCPGGQPCVIDLDCLSIRCTDGVCEAPNCADHLRNGDETDVDCGGSCSPCGFSSNCLEHADCSGGICGGNNRCAYGESCAHILSANPEAQDGLYQIDPEQDSYLPLWAYCDMHTDGGGWTLVLNYVHLAGTNPQLYNSPDKLPWMVATDLGADEQGTFAWRHPQNGLFATLPVTEMRFYGKTSAHGRVMDFVTDLPSCIAYFATGNGSCEGIQYRYRPLADHTSYLPDWADSFYADQGNQAMTNFTFYTDTSGDDQAACWAVHGDERDWSLDHIRAGGGFDTMHQIWVRAAPSHCTDGTRNFSEKDIDCGGLCAACADDASCTDDVDCRGLCVDGICESPANCTEIKLLRPQAADGSYQIDPDGDGALPAMEAYCDMTTDGGGWTMVLNYMHQGGTDPQTPMFTDHLPRMGSDRLGKDESGTPFFGHAGPALLAALAPAQMRFVGQSSAHGRIMDFITDSTDCIGYFEGQPNANCGDLTRKFTLLPDHSAWLPAALDGVNRAAGDAELLTLVPFVATGRATWNIGVGGWDVDDWAAGDAADTRHRVFVRSVPASCGDGDLNGDESDVDCGGSCPDRCAADQACGGSDDCQSGICDQNLCQLSRDCSHILWANPTAASGEYLVDLDEDGALEPSLVYCDMDTDGGGWTLVANYLHQAGTSPAPVALGDHLPLRGSDLLGPDESLRPAFWGHASNALFAVLDVAELRFNGRTSHHGRLLDFYTTDESCIDYLTTGANADGCMGVAKNFHLLPGHQSSLPQVVDLAASDRGDNAMIDHPFWRAYAHHWVAGLPRWDVDDWSVPDNAHHTMHRVWVRAAPDHCQSGVADGDEAGVDCGGSCPATCARLAADEACTDAAQCVTGVCTNDVCTLAANCTEILMAQPGAQTGDYQIDPDGSGGLDPFFASCDMVTDGGGWTLVGNYMHQGGTNPALVPLSLATPLWGSNVIGSDESQDGQHWGHASLSLFHALSPTEVRFDGFSTNANRPLNFSSTRRQCVDYFATGEGSCDRIAGHHRILPGNRAYLPASRTGGWDGPALDANATNGRDDAMMAFPFYEGGQRHWGAGTIGRWEVDDYANNANSHTMHRVWSRSCPRLLAEDFDDLDPAGWSFVDEVGATSEGPSTWEIRDDGVLRELSNIYGVGPDGYPRGTLALWNDAAALAWTDYRFNVATYNADNDDIGVVFRYQDEDNFYKLELNLQEQYQRLYRVKDGVMTIVAEAPEPGFVQSSWFLLEVAVSGDRIEVSRNGAALFGGPVYDPAGLDAGTVGLYNAASTGTHFDDVVVFGPCR